MIEVRPVFLVVLWVLGTLKLDDNSRMKDRRNRSLPRILHSSASSVVYRNINTHMQTSVYAISVPIDIMFINCCKSNMLDSIAKRTRACYNILKHYYIILFLYFSNCNIVQGFIIAPEVTIIKNIIL